MYVAITRTRNKLFIPSQFLPASFQLSENSETIHVLKTDSPEEVQEELATTSSGILQATASKSYSVAEFRTRYKDAYKPWTDEIDKQLSELFAEGTKVKDLSTQFGRTNGAIRSRIKKLNLRE